MDVVTEAAGPEAGTKDKKLISDVGFTKSLKHWFRAINASSVTTT